MQTVITLFYGIFPTVAIYFVKYETFFIQSFVTITFVDFSDLSLIFHFLMNAVMY